MKRPRQRIWVRFSVVRRRLFFSLIVLVAVLGLGTAILKVLEAHGLLQTERADDRVAYLPDRWLLQSRGQFRFHNRSMLAETFPVRKPARTIRLVTTGESFMMGSPFVSPERFGKEQGGIPDWLGAELPLRYPSLRFEVINAACGGQNSFRVREIVDGLVGVHPDLLIIGVGNNEGYVPLTRFNEELHKWIVYRVLKRSLLPSPADDERAYFSPQDPDTRRIEENYRANMRGMVVACRQAKAPVMLLALPINWKYDDADPRDHGQSGSASDDPRIAHARRLMERGDLNGAERLLVRSPQQGYAALYLARIAERRGDLAQARKLYRLHVQLVPNNRTRPSYNDFVRQLAREQNVALADLEAAVDRLAGPAISPPGVWMDYCHMSKRGYYLMEQEIMRVLIEQRIVPAGPGEPAPTPTRERLIELTPKLGDYY